MAAADFQPEQDPMMADQFPDGGLRIKVMGVGGAGTNAVDRIKLQDLAQMHLTAIDTDSQVLAASPVEETFLLGRSVTCGKSTGGSTDKGREAVAADREGLRVLFHQVDLVFILAGLGGGTGSGAAPALAALAAEQGALVIAFCTLPFQREGKVRMDRAKAGMAALQEHCHAVISLPNDVIFKQIDDSATLMEAFALADNWIKLGVHSIWSMLLNTGIMNVDFSTLRSALAEPGGRTLFGIGYAKGDSLVEKAIKDLEQCPLLHLSDGAPVKDTDQLVVNVTGGPDLTMAMVNDLMDAVARKFDCRHSLIMGAAIDGSFHNQLRVTVLGTCRPATVKKGFAPVPAASIPPNAPPEPVMPAKVRENLPSDPFPEAPSATPQPAAASPAKISPAPPQEEFAFPRQDQDRGVFSKTGRNLYEGVDLDIPTYVRRGIKLLKL